MYGWQWVDGWLETSRAQEYVNYSTHPLLDSGVAKHSNSSAITASSRLDNRACVVLPSPIHGRVALDENLCTLNGVFLSEKSILNPHS